MIIRRYISLQVLATAAAVVLVLTAILMSGRVIKYFGMAADGRLDVRLLTAVLLYRLPGFLDIIVPLGLFIAILLTFGRLYLDNEMSVLFASGFSRAQVVGCLLLPVLVTMTVVAATSLYVTPAGSAASERLFAEQAAHNTFDLVRPGRFQAVGRRMLYAAALSPDRKRLLDVRLFEQKPAAGAPRQILVQAESGRSELDPASGERFLVLENGTRYELAPGAADYREIRFGTYRVRLPRPVAVESLSQMGSHDSLQLYAERAGNARARAELLWRLSMPLLVPATALLAFALSRVNPRQGRYLKLLPAILLYMSYLVALAATRNNIEKGRLPDAALWGVHLGYLALALLLLGWERLRQGWRQWRRAAA